MRLSDNFRYIESRKNKNLLPGNTDIDFKVLFSNDNPMFEVYKTMASIFKVPLSNDTKDLELFTRLKTIVTQLVVVNPKERMKLKDARNEIEKLKKEFRHNFLLLNPFLQQKDDPTMTHTDETTQNSLRLMNEIRSTRLFTIPTTGEDKKLTQRLTNLCVSVTAMRLLSYALVDFLEPHCKGNATAWKDLKDKILKYPDNPKTDEERENANAPQFVASTSADRPEGYSQGLKQVKKEKLFIQQLITICCGVISPRSLNGLNHCHLDDDFHTAAQEQNIRK